MPRAAPFEEHTERYDAWFEANEAAYESELAALRRLRPRVGAALEIGVGSGRFAAPLGVDVGIDPASDMLALARDRGIAPVRGVAENLPVAGGRFDTALLVTTICFVDDLDRTFEEARRVLAPDGALVVGYIDEATPIGEIYLEKQDANPFYREATFHSTEAVLAALDRTGFADVDVVQTIFRWPDEMDERDPVESGYGDGAFVGIRATP